MIIRAYHGSRTVSGPEEFDPWREVYLTDNESLAASFGTRVLHLEVEGSKVYELDWMGCSWGGGYFPSDDGLFKAFLDHASEGDEEERAYWNENGMCVDMFASYLKSEGYNLLILHNVKEEHGFSSTEYVALQGCIIKNCEDEKHEI